jgi:DNA-binding transcriptional regulator YiaG
MTAQPLTSRAPKEGATKWVTLKEYRPDIGAPFEVILHNAVKQKIDTKTGDVLATKIPNLRGLLKEVAVARSLCSRKFSAEEIKFLRKAVGLKGTELSKLIGIGPEHLSRCENRERALSVSAEKLFRMIVLKKRFNFAGLEAWAANYFATDERKPEMDSRLREMVKEYREYLNEVEVALYNADLECVYDVDDTLQFDFVLASPADSDSNGAAEDERWKRAA